MPHYEVIVIGIGCMGSAACASLSRRGIKVLGLEQHTIPNDLGSSGHQSRIFRLAYYEHADYVPLLKQVYKHWQQLNDLADEPVLLETGGLYMGPEGGDFVELSQASAITHVDSKDPPILFLHSKDDTTVPWQQSRDMHRAMKAAGVASEIRLYETGGHGVDPKGAKPMGEMIAFFQKRL